MNQSYKAQCSISVTLIRPTYPCLRKKELFEKLNLSSDASPFDTDIENEIFSRIRNENNVPNFHTDWSAEFWETQAFYLERDHNIIHYNRKFDLNTNDVIDIKYDPPYVVSKTFSNEYSTTYAVISNVSLTITLEISLSSLED